MTPGANIAISDQAEDNSQNAVRLWLDDTRPAPDQSWTWVKTVDAAIGHLRSGNVIWASLDNDLGMSDGVTLTEGRKLVLWMAENDIWPLEKIEVHSSNAVAVEYMNAMISRYGPYRRPKRVGGRLSFQV